MKEEKLANERERVNLGHNNSSVLPMIPAPLAGRERSIRTHTACRQLDVGHRHECLCVCMSVI